MSSPNYQQLPTSEDVTDELEAQQPIYASPSGLPEVANSQSGYRTRFIFAIVVAFLVTAYFSFKVDNIVLVIPGAKQTPATSSATSWSGQTSTTASATVSVSHEPIPTLPSVPVNGTLQKKRSIAYFPNWSVYARKYVPQYLPVGDLTHIFYSFAKVDPESGAVQLTDPWADKDLHYENDSWNTPPDELHLFGNFKALYMLKRANRHLKVLLSIGGMDSSVFHPVVADGEKRKQFVSDAVTMLEDYGLDGLDIDYEFPVERSHVQGYVYLLKELRDALDEKEQANGNGCHFILTIAAPAGPSFYKKLLIPEMDQYLDFWNLMTYDYSGTWSGEANHQANMFGQPFSSKTALDYYSSQGVASDKLILGIPLYGRSFANTDGPGRHFDGAGGGTWENGIYDYNVLPLKTPGTETAHNMSTLASWTYNSITREFISYDSPAIAREKGRLIKEYNLGGSMFWEITGDTMPSDTAEERQNMVEREGKLRASGMVGPGKDLRGGESLVRIVKHAMTDRKSGLDTSPNWLMYPRSKFVNLRAGMP